MYIYIYIIVYHLLQSGCPTAEQKRLTNNA